MATESQPPTKQLISQNAYIVWLRWPLSKVPSLTFKKGNDKYFPKHCRHFRCRKSLHTDLLPQTNKSGRLLLLPCSCNSCFRRRAFLLVHQNLVRDRGHHRGKGHTPIKLLAKTVQCSDVCFDCRASLLGRHIFSQVSFLFYFRALVNRLYRMEVWWWFTFAVLVPSAAISIAGAFIVCAHTGSSILGMLDLSPYKVPY